MSSSEGCDSAFQLLRNGWCGAMVMSPVYRCRNTALKELPKKRGSSFMRARYVVRPWMSSVRYNSSACSVREKRELEKAAECGSVDSFTNGAMCGFACETIVRCTWNMRASCSAGMSTAIDPSMLCTPETRWYGTDAPRWSTAMSVTGRMRPGSAQLAATADQISTSGAVR
jgi:hypothetical protein